MYAVIQTGGKQYRVETGSFVQVEKLDGDLNSSYEFNDILLVSKPDKENSQVWLGKPFVKNAKVQAEVVSQGRDKKILIVKKKRRKGYMRTQGHRQEQTQLLITNIDNGSGEASSLSAAEKKEKLNKFFSQLKPKAQFDSQLVKPKAETKAVKKTTTKKKTTKTETSTAKAK